MTDSSHPPDSEAAEADNVGQEPTVAPDTDQSDGNRNTTQGAHGSEAVFRSFAGDGAATASTSSPHRDLDVIREIPVTLSVELGATRLSIRELLELTKGSVVELDGLAGEPINILVNNYLVAHGEVVVVDEKYGVRVTDIVDKAERIGQLKR